MISQCDPSYSPDLRRRRSLHLLQAQKVQPSRTPLLALFSQKLALYLLSLKGWLVSELYNLLSSLWLYRLVQPLGFRD